MSANLRIQWLHKKISEMSYPNAKRLAERFNISHRQAQRDVDFLRAKLSAPIAYDYDRKGFYYTEEFTLPIALTTANNEDYNGIVAESPMHDADAQSAENTVVQLQVPYSAELKLSDRLTVVELGNYITDRIGDNIYRCEFHSIEKFMSVIMSLDSDIQILKPDWLRSRILRCAERIIRNNSDIK
ncbi:MAG: WYL domain-containing protein [Clostridia bacterium]|nr:WYL domain-containing protein [Clostridia bacterium]